MSEKINRIDACFMILDIKLTAVLSEKGLNEL